MDVEREDGRRISRFKRLFHQNTGIKDVGKELASILKGLRYEDIIGTDKDVFAG
jgi:hypothetical protein